MMRIACFNELSILPLCKTRTEAEQRLKYFVKLLQQVRQHTKITKIRYAGDLSKIYLTKEMTIQDYCNANARSPIAITLLSMFIKPQVDMEDDITLQKYLDTTTEIKMGNGKIRPADGFNAAYCQTTFCVGFNSNSLWDNDFFPLTVISNKKARKINWPCISSQLFYSDDQEHRHRKPTFDQWWQSILPIEPLESTKLPIEKSIALRDDHGKDKLTAHAKMLCGHPLVEGILTSLPFKSFAKEYIHKIYDDGTLDIVLWWEDKGLSMRIKTTGRNIAETRLIASILKEKYGKK